MGPASEPDESSRAPPCRQFVDLATAFDPLAKVGQVLRGGESSSNCRSWLCFLCCQHKSRADEGARWGGVSLGRFPHHVCDNGRIERRIKIECIGAFRREDGRMADDDPTIRGKHSSSIHEYPFGRSRTIKESPAAGAVTSTLECRRQVFCCWQADSGVKFDAALNVRRHRLCHAISFSESTAFNATIELVNGFSNSPANTCPQLS